MPDAAKAPTVSSPQSVAAAEPSAAIAAPAAALADDAAAAAKKKKKKKKKRKNKVDAATGGMSFVGERWLRVGYGIEKETQTEVDMIGRQTVDN